MSPFFNAQSADPFDPTPMLIHADWLEEQGDATGAAALRALAEGGTPSLIAAALDAALASIPYRSDLCKLDEESEDGDGAADGHGFMGRVGHGHGDGDAHGHGYGSGRGYGSRFLIGSESGSGGGYGDGHGSEAGYGDGEGSGDEFGA